MENREIKFRAWNVVTKTMIDLKKITPLALNMDTDGLFIPFSDGLPLMQYTGQKDSSGKEIYEGDVYRDVVVMDDEQSVEETLYFVCAFVKSMSAFCWLDVNEYVLGLHDYDKFPDDLEKPYTIDADELHKIKVIGNIYEKPEYLKLN